MTETRTVIVEREFSQSPEKLWRALTQPHLITEWLMKNNFEPAEGHEFKLHVETPQWSGIIDCKVLAIEPQNKLSYTWSSMGLDTVVTFTLTPTNSGVHLRMEQSGFPMDREQNFRGATWGWNNFLGKLEQVVAKL
jgi:uncharacterized protein YndB with AHSA1/START domain